MLYIFIVILSSTSFLVPIKARLIRGITHKTDKFMLPEECWDENIYYKIKLEPLSSYTSVCISPLRLSVVFKFKMPVLLEVLAQG